MKRIFSKIDIFIVVRYIIASFLVGWLILIIRGYDESLTTKTLTPYMWWENQLIGFIIVGVILFLLKKMKII